VGIVRRNSSFLLTIALILGIGASIFGGVVAVRVAAAESAAPVAASTTITSNNPVSSYGLGSLPAATPSATGYEPLVFTPTAETPAFITDRLAEQKGIVLLVYCEGASDDMAMLSSFNTVKGQYAADTTFMAFEAVATTELGDTLDQLRVSDPPILAIIRGDGVVSELYTGWIGLKVMEQRVADAVRGL
jgi:hypothetical protein